MSVMRTGLGADERREMGVDGWEDGVRIGLTSGTRSPLLFGPVPPFDE